MENKEEYFCRHSDDIGTGDSIEGAFSDLYLNSYDDIKFEDIEFFKLVPIKVKLICENE